MPRSHRNDNFIDKTFTIIADLLLKVIPTSRISKEAFVYYRDGLAAQSEGEYAEALMNYYEALRRETDPFDRSYIFYNIGLIHTANGKNRLALEYYFSALDRNPTLTQALNNIAVLYHDRREQSIECGQIEVSQLLFLRAREYWEEAIRLSPTHYSEAHNWISITRSRLFVFSYYVYSTQQMLQLIFRN
jgi:tetratricopeptide (TPR) repeat protein